MPYHPPPPPPAAIEQPASGGASSVIAGPVWIRRPTGAEIERAYPAKALKTRPKGHAAAVCTVTALGTLTDCRITAEDPPGLGFGAAALALTRIYRMRPLVDGHSVSGATLPVSIIFMPPRNDF